MPSSNPLWFGYYPGDKPIPRRPGIIRPGPGFDTSGLGLNSVIDEAAAIAERPSELPNQLKDWIVDDWKISFNVGTTPATQTGFDLYEFGREEAADVKGTYVVINPFDLVTDPKKAITKFVDSSLGAINPFRRFGSFDTEFWNDLDTLSERDMWRMVVNPTEFATSAPPSFKLVQSAYGPIDFNKQGIYADTNLYFSTAGKQGIKVAAGVADAGIDVYEQAAAGVLGFVAGKKSSFTRNDRYRDMQSALYNAAATEIKVKNSTIQGILGADPNMGETLLRVNAFGLENDLLKNMSELNKGIDGAAKLIAKKGLTEGISAGEVQKAFTDLSDAARDLRANINLTKTQYSTFTIGRDAFANDVKELETFLTDVENLAAGYAGLPGTKVLSLFEREGVASQVAQLSNRFANGRYDGGIYDRYLQTVGRRYFEGEKSILQTIGTMTDPASGNSLVATNGFRSLGTVYDIHKRGYLQEAGRDLVDTVAKGNFGKTYVYLGAIKGRIQMFTPAYWTGKIMQKTQMLGLVYKDNVTPIHPVFNNLPWIMKNKFTERFSVTVGASTFKVSANLTGSKHLGAFYEAWSRSKDGKLIGVYAGGAVTSWATDPNANYKALLALINNKSGNVGSFGAGMQYIVSGDKNWGLLTLQANQMRGELIKSGLPFDVLNGELLETDKNKALLEGLFAKIKLRKTNAATLDPFVEKVGLLQIYASKLSQIQQAIFTKTGITKLVSPFVHLKAVVAQRVANLAAKIATKLGLKVALTALLGGATGGLGAALVPVVEKVLNAIISKVVDKAKDMFRMFLKGDLMGAINSFIDDAAAATEKVIIIGCFMPILFVGIILFLLGTVITSVPLGDRWRTPSATATGAVAPPARLPDSAQTSCVFPSYIITTYSFSNALEPAPGSRPWRHGSNEYWAPRDTVGAGGRTQVNGMEDCSKNIPYFIYSIRAKGPSTYTDSWCNDSRWAVLLRGYYGYALDVVPSSGVDSAWAVTPRLGVGGNIVQTWSASKRSTDDGSGAGCWVTLTGNDGTYVYEIHILHLECDSLGSTASEYRPGDPIALLYAYSGGKHVHLEMRVNTDFVKPEDWLCR